MLQVSNVSLQFGSRILFKDVNLKFTKGNCYGVIGANGAGKSTFLKILSGDLEPNKGDVIISGDERLSVLNQDQNAFNNFTVIETVLFGHKRLMEINKKKEELYSKSDFSEEDGMIASHLEEEFAMLDGWNAESNASTLLQGLGVSDVYHSHKMSDLDAKQKLKFFLLRAYLETQIYLS